MNSSLTMLLPQITNHESQVLIRLLPVPDGGEKAIPCECVIDLNGADDVIGVEIINFRLQAGTDVFYGKAQAALSASAIRMSYDDEVDAFYLKLSEGRSINQRVVKGRMLLSSNGYLLGLEVAKRIGVSP